MFPCPQVSIILYHKSPSKVNPLFNQNPQGLSSKGLGPSCPSFNPTVKPTVGYIQITPRKAKNALPSATYRVGKGIDFPPPQNRPYALKLPSPFGGG